MSATVTDLSNVRTSIDKPPTDCQTRTISTPAVFAEERQALLYRQWAGLAVAADVPEPGDAKPLEFLGMPLLLIRDKDGDVRVFPEHLPPPWHDPGGRAPQDRRRDPLPLSFLVLFDQGQAGQHPACGRPGPQTHEAIKRDDDLGLIEVRSHIWRDVVWINVSGDAPAFEEVHADLIDRWKDFDKPLYHGGRGQHVHNSRLRTNWKLAVENYCESYHLPWVHPGLNSYSRLEDHYHIEQPGQYSGQGTMVYRQLTNENGDTFPDFEDVGAKWNEQAEYIAVYPNVLLGVHRDHAFTIILEPRGLEKTAEHVHLYYAVPDSDGGLRDRNTRLWKSVFEEDVFVVEGMQKGRHADMFDGGRFSPVMDSPTHVFHQWVAAKVDSHRAMAKAAE